MVRVVPVNAWSVFKTRESEIRIHLTCILLHDGIVMESTPLTILYRGNTRREHYRLLHSCNREALRDVHIRKQAKSGVWDPRRRNAYHLKMPSSAQALELPLRVRRTMMVHTVNVAVATPTIAPHGLLPSGGRTASTSLRRALTQSPPHDTVPSRQATLPAGSGALL